MTTSPRTGSTDQLLDAVRALSRAASAREVAEVAAAWALPAVGAAAAVVGSVGPDGRAVAVLASVGDPPWTAASRHAVDARSPVCDALREGAPVEIASPAALERYPADGSPRWTGGASLVVALPGAGGASGYLGLGFATWEPPRDEARSLALALAGEVAAALDRARVLDEAQRDRRRLQILAEATEAFGARGVSLADLPLVVARHTSRATGDVALVRLLSADGQWLDAKACWAPDEATREAARAATEGQRQRVGAGLAGEVAETGRTLLLPVADRATIEHEPSAGVVGFLERLPACGLVVAPLEIEGRVIGTLSIARARPDEPCGDWDRRLVESIATRAALAIHRARLNEERDLLLAREQQVRRDAETASRAKDEFLAMLGHELRNPLSPMLTALDLMRMSGNDAFERERTIIERQVRHVVRLVDDLLDVSRISRGKVELKKQPVELSKVVAASIEIASPLLESRRHRLEVEVPRSGLLVLGDPARLAQVVANLLTNAAKYTEAHGRVTVAARREGQNVVLRVRDTGMGIPAELLPRIFDLFVQGKRALDRSQGGLGLGLTIVQSIVTMHGGEVSVASEGVGRGTEFVVRLPFLRAPAIPTPPPAPSTIARGHSRDRRVLVVDDNEDAAEALVSALEASGYAAMVAYDGPAALELATRVRPQAALLDIGLPVMDGYELGRRLRDQLGPDLKLVALTGYGQDRDRERSRSVGFDEHMVKPVELRELLDLLQRLLRDANEERPAPPP
jgi:signal transduction histidine kinase/ActR/RegA family two-component response regulator